METTYSLAKKLGLNSGTVWSFVKEKGAPLDLEGFWLFYVEFHAVRELLRRNYKAIQRARQRLKYRTDQAYREKSLAASRKHNPTYRKSEKGVARAKRRLEKIKRGEVLDVSPKLYTKEPRLKCAKCLLVLGFGHDRTSSMLGKNIAYFARLIKRQLPRHDQQRFNKLRTAEARRRAGILAILLDIITKRVLIDYKADFENEVELLKARPKPQPKPRPQRHREREMFRYRNDPLFKIKFTLRKQLRKLVKGELKVDRKQMFGCSVEHLKAHLQSQFSKGMNWNNHGKWHIDHIVPCSSFDLSKIEEQRKCFHWTNLRPLWARENLIKNDKIENAQLGLLLNLE